jgi:hypothetical protein
MITRDPIEDQIRHTLHTVASTITAETHPRDAATPTRPRSQRRRWSLIGGAVAVPVLLAAGAYVRSGPEYVDQIPADTIIVRGDVDGDRYLLVESRRTYLRCDDRPVPGVELVEEDENLLGSEWNTIGEMYGEGGGDCGPDTSRYLANPALYNDGGTAVGDSFVWLWAVHPDVTAVRITTEDSSEDLPVYAVDGAGYALYEIPSDVRHYTAELLIGDRVVPGSTEEQRVPATH